MASIIARLQCRFRSTKPIRIGRGSRRWAPEHRRPLKCVWARMGGVTRPLWKAGGRSPRVKLRAGVLISVSMLWLGAAGTAMAQTVVARWHMDEQAGTVMHDSAGNYDGTVHKAALGLTGFQGYSYGFNGTSAYVSVPSAPALNPGDGSFT